MIGIILIVIGSVMFLTACVTGVMGYTGYFTVEAFQLRRPKALPEKTFPYNIEEKIRDLVIIVMISGALCVMVGCFI